MIKRDVTQGRNAIIVRNDREKLSWTVYLHCTGIRKLMNERKISLQRANRLLHDMFEKLVASLRADLNRRKRERHYRLWDTFKLSESNTIWRTASIGI